MTKPYVCGGCGGPLHNPDKLPNVFCSRTRKVELVENRKPLEHGDHLLLEAPPRPKAKAPAEPPAPRVKRGPGQSAIAHALGRRVRQAREAAGMTRKVFAEKVEMRAVTENWLWRFESGLVGKPPSDEMLEAFNQVLGMRIEYPTAPEARSQLRADNTDNGTAAA